MALNSSFLFLLLLAHDMSWKPKVDLYPSQPRGAFLFGGCCPPSIPEECCNTSVETHITKIKKAENPDSAKSSKVANRPSQTQTSQLWLSREELRLQPVNNEFVEIPRGRFIFVEKTLLPQKGKIIVQAYQGTLSSTFPIEVFLYNDDWAQVQLNNQSSNITQFRLLYFNPIEMYLKLIVCKNVAPKASFVAVMNALGQPLGCTGKRWAFGIRATDVVEGRSVLNFYDWEGEVLRTADCPVKIIVEDFDAADKAKDSIGVNWSEDDEVEKSPNSLSVGKTKSKKKNKKKKKKGKGKKK